MKHSDLAFVAIELLACSWRQLIVEERGAPRRSTSPRRRMPAVRSRPGSARSRRGPRMNSERRLSAVPRDITD